MWKKNGKGPAFKSHYMRDQSGERIMILIRIKADGTAEIKTAESWQMLKAAGWRKA
jgi:hypothetical protein